MNKLINAFKVFWKVLNGYGVIYNINLHTDHLKISGPVWLHEIRVRNPGGSIISIYQTDPTLTET